MRYHLDGLVRTLFLIICASSLAGCAVFDGFSGGDDTIEPPCSGDCPPLTCDTPFRAPPVGNFFTVDVCDQFQSFGEPRCGSPFGVDAIIEVSVPTPGRHMVCLEGGLDGSLRVARECPGPPPVDDEFLCVSQNVCQEIVLPGPRALLAFRTDNPSDCGQVSIDMFFLDDPLPLESPIDCFDGIDNDNNGDTDCMDTACRGFTLPVGGTCDANLDADEVCDGIDNGVAAGFDPDELLVDESACRCVDDSGCQGLFDNQGEEYLCHQLIGDPTLTGGVCNPNCITTSWCQTNGGTCLNDGRCIN